MRDIVATIQSDQYRLITHDPGSPLVIQGGPGTGKTAVGLHRAALLLYDHREQLERDGGVLVVGPNPLFLRYIGQVLPSLGETSVVQTTVAGLCTVAVRADDPDEAAALKGDERMVAVIGEAAWGRVQPPTDDWHMRTGWGDVRLTAAEVAGTLERVLASERGRTVASARERLRVELVKAAHDHLTAKRHDLGVVAPDVREHLARHGALRRHIDALLPPITAPALVRRLLSNPAFLDAVSGNVLTVAERRMLRRRRGSAASGTTWTLGDAVLIDEAEAVLGGSRPRRFGHVVVDEAQDLTPMALRVVRRRVSRFPSLTLLGDLAQASAPGATASWGQAAAALGAAEATVHLAVLTTGYRVPGQIIELANRLLDEIGVAVEPTGSARTTPLAPWARFVARPSDLAAQAAHVAAALASRHRTVGLIAAEADHAAITDSLGTAAQLVSGAGEITIVRPIEAKGLEFDAVVVLEPAALADGGRSGLSLLYVAITRAVQELVVVHHRPLPSALTDIDAG